MRQPTEEEKAANPDIVEMVEDLQAISDISAITDSEGGKALVKTLVDDIVSCMDLLAAKYSSLTHPEFIAYCADMKSKMDLVRVITRAPKNKQTLESMIAETIKE